MYNRARADSNHFDDLNASKIKNSTAPTVDTNSAKLTGAVDVYLAMDAHQSPATTTTNLSAKNTPTKPVEPIRSVTPAKLHDSFCGMHGGSPGSKANNQSSVQAGRLQSHV